MGELPHSLLGEAVTIDDALKEEFEVRLVDSSTLVFRVAYSVLRHREDAEDVAQEVFAKAYRAFRQLRDRERFRAWVVRMAFRMALDRQRAKSRFLVAGYRRRPALPELSGPHALDWRDGGNGRVLCAAPDQRVLDSAWCDWDDSKAARILAAIREAAAPGAKLLLIECIVPEDSKPSWTKMLDLQMLTLCDS